MKERLDQLTIQELIELSCGDYTVLFDGDEKPTDGVLLKVRAILSEYRSIASPAQARVELMDSEKLSKYNIKEKCANICMVLCFHGRSDLARDILVQLGVSESNLATEEEIIAHCQSIIGEAKYEAERIAERKAKNAKRSTQEQTRHEWYSEIASVMSILKVPIDMSLNAAIYANLVRQAVEHSKAMAKMPPSARMFM